MKKIIILFILLFIIPACNYRIARHIWELEPPSTIELKLNGYYINEDYVEKFYPIILYSDGTIFFADGDYLNSFNFEKRITNKNDSIYLYRSLDWGRYSIKKDTIIIRCPSFVGGGIGGPHSYLTEIKGKILNDHSFILLESYDYIQYYYFNNRKTKIINNSYSFKSFANKPDSLNWTFKYKEKMEKKKKRKK